MSEFLISPVSENDTLEHFAHTLEMVRKAPGSPTDGDEGVLPPGAPGPGSVETFRAASGHYLRYRIVASSPTRHRLLYLHGIESHGAWFLPMAYLLRNHGCTTYLLDRRGSGLNRQTTPGDRSSIKLLLEDIRSFRKHLGDPDLHLVGLSWGGKLAMAAALDQPRALKSLILITPGLKAQVDLPLRSKIALFLGLFLLGRNKLNIPIQPEMFTQTSRFLEFIRNDPWRLREVSGRLLFGSQYLERMVNRRIRELRLPTLLFLAGRDRIIDNQGVIETLFPLDERKVQIILFEEATHSLQFDQMESTVDQIVSFLKDLEEAR